MKRRGYFFSLDAFIASSLVVIGILIITLFYTYRPYDVQSTLLSQDLVDTMSSVRVIQLSDNYTRQLIRDGNITNPYNSIFQQIGEFCYEGKNETAKEFAENVVIGIMPESYNVQITVREGDFLMLIASRKEADDASRVLVSSKAILMGKTIDGRNWGPYEGEVRIWH